MAASLLFGPGERPDISAIAELSRGCSEFSISFDPSGGDCDVELVAGERDRMYPPRWLELLANGLTFDLAGLAPGPSRPTLAKGHGYGLPPDFAADKVEAITLQPGPHLAGGGAMLPIVRTLAWLTAQLALLPGVRAIAWHPGRCWSAPQQFRNGVLDWIEGGPFPMFSLAALAPASDGGYLSEGLALFTGQELHLNQDLEGKGARVPKAASRLAHWLVGHGRLTQPVVLSDIDGLALRIEPSHDYHFVNVKQM